MEKPVAEECFCVNGFSEQKACPQFTQSAQKACPQFTQA
jgi:hypothetical protein